jgi:uncharacterized membrane protein YvbJ
MLLCRSCGQDNPEVARFCLACGASLASERAALERGGYANNDVQRLVVSVA